MSVFPRLKLRRSDCLPPAETYLSAKTWRKGFTVGHATTGSHKVTVYLFKVWKCWNIWSLKNVLMNQMVMNTNSLTWIWREIKTLSLQRYPESGLIFWWYPPPFILLRPPAPPPGLCLESSTGEAVICRRQTDMADCGTVALNHNKLFILDRMSDHGVLIQQTARPLRPWSESTPHPQLPPAQRDSPRLNLRSFTGFRSGNGQKTNKQKTQTHLLLVRVSKEASNSSIWKFSQTNSNCPFIKVQWNYFLWSVL